ncbi:unnamed protein product [Vitrella brassicaformis CCMP3155]|uniref:Uncharacterized protein n=1 Tax=Vitrella brassicaformis (strain CCMP3155) TaxID=1169540 RepID=A0A0G4GKK6_VITBC|nr:unnamed protein product [Vitrella brassicaformis CCMP3155]|eukprot:CEM30563.1 unnamed protein product [Vitrella brassicaformis CCMP3155]
MMCVKVDVVIVRCAGQCRRCGGVFEASSIVKLHCSGAAEAFFPRTSRHSFGIQYTMPVCRTVPTPVASLRPHSSAAESGDVQAVFACVTADGGEAFAEAVIEAKQDFDTVAVSHCENVHIAPPLG